MEEDPPVTKEGGSKDDLTKYNLDEYDDEDDMPSEHAFMASLFCFHHNLCSYGTIQQYQRAPILSKQRCRSIYHAEGRCTSPSFHNLKPFI